MPPRLPLVSAAVLAFIGIATADAQSRNANSTQASIDGDVDAAIDEELHEAAAADGGCADVPRVRAPSPVARLPDGMVALPGGVYRMAGRVVTVGPYALDRSEVTAGQWRACVTAGACDVLPDPWHRHAEPHTAVTDVSWPQAVAYCHWAGGRLPTEAEWELAARGVSSARYPWGESSPDCAHARGLGCGDGLLVVGIHPLGQTPTGLMDLAGNAAEWVADLFAPLPTVGCADNPTGPRTGRLHVVRGGSFVSDATGLEGRARVGVDGREGRYDVGLRCARGL